MTRKQLITHWGVIEAYKNGEDVQLQSATGTWINSSTPEFHEDNEYRIKPYEPKIGEIVLVSDHKKNWSQSIYVGKGRDGRPNTIEPVTYKDLVDSEFCNFDSLTIYGWRYIKPLKK